MYLTGKSTRLAGTVEKVGFRGRKKPSEKHGIDGRFVAYYCEQCEDSGTMMCSHCQGSGIGSTGPVDSSTCQHCYPIKGSGSVPCDGEAHEYE